MEKLSTYNLCNFELHFFKAHTLPIWNESVACRDANEIDSLVVFFHIYEK